MQLVFPRKVHHLVSAYPRYVHGAQRSQQYIVEIGPYSNGHACPRKRMPSQIEPFLCKIVGVIQCHDPT